MKKIKVVYRKLGKERAHGLSYLPDMGIELDIRLKGKKHLEILVHEALHLLVPEWSETKVIEKSKELTKVLWAENYRRVQQ